MGLHVLTRWTRPEDMPELCHVHQQPQHEGQRCEAVEGLPQRAQEDPAGQPDMEFFPVYYRRSLGATQQGYGAT